MTAPRILGWVAVAITVAALLYAPMVLRSYGIYLLALWAVTTIAALGLSARECEVLEMLDIAAVSYRLVLTKTDKIKASDLAAVHAATEAEARKHPAAHPEVIATSSEKGMGIAELRTAVLEAVES